MTSRAWYASGLGRNAQALGKFKEARHVTTNGRDVLYTGCIARDRVRWRHARPRCGGCHTRQCRHSHRRILGTEILRTRGLGVLAGRSRAGAHGWRRGGRRTLSAPSRLRCTAPSGRRYCHLELQHRRDSAVRLRRPLSQKRRAERSWAGRILRVLDHVAVPGGRQCIRTRQWRVPAPSLRSRHAVRRNTAVRGDE